MRGNSPVRFGGGPRGKDLPNRNLAAWSTQFVVGCRRLRRTQAVPGPPAPTTKVPLDAAGRVDAKASRNVRPAFVKWYFNEVSIHTVSLVDVVLKGVRSRSLAGTRPNSLV